MAARGNLLFVQNQRKLEGTRQMHSIIRCLIDMISIKVSNGCHTKKLFICFPEMSVFLKSKKSRPHLDEERGWSGANEHFTQQNRNINYRIYL
jgi:hypothetical protein